MTPRDARQTIKALTVLTLLAVVAPCASVAQFTRGSLAERERQIIEDIDRARSREGPHAESLIGPLTALALLYQEEGDRLLATATIERALQVVRANYGLYALEQAPFIQQLIANEEEIGNIDAAWNLQQELLTLARRHPEDLRSVPIFRGLAEKRLNLLQQYKAGEWPREFFLGCYYDYPHRLGGEPRSCTSGSRTFAIGRILAEVHSHYAEAIEVILSNELYSSEELRELEMEAVRATLTSGLIGRGVECEIALDQLLEMEPLGSCLAPLRGVGGGSSLVRLLLYEIRSSAPALTQLSALIRLADYLHWLHWQQLRRSSMRRTDDSAMELYSLALEKLKEMGEASTIDDVFSPAVPVALPAFAPNALLSEETPDSTGYVDVAFDINKRGGSDRIEILATRSVSRDAEKELIRMIKQSCFRPRAGGGQFAGSSRVTVRYYVNE